MGEKDGFSSVKVGRRAEDLALSYLIGRGYRLVDRNWRYHHLELDLIMFSNKGLHIVEVRSLRAPVLVMPYETVDVHKRRRIVRAASSYVNRRRIGCEVFFDIVSIVFERDSYTIDYIEQAFLPFR